MVPAFVVLHIYQGQTFNDVVTLNNTDGTPIDLSAKQARMHIRAYHRGPLILSLGTADGTIILDALGQITFNLSATVTAALETMYDYEQYVYDCELVEDDGIAPEFVERALQGVVILWPEITRG